MNNIKGIDERPVTVSIRCCTYNQEKYIRDTLEGFVMQKTNFRFEAIVHDDASTDGTADIIREYAEKYPDIIKPIYETENQYSKHDGSLRKIMDAACIGKYIALCEGDDYWTDSLKLQKQVDFLETHPDYSMCFHNADRYSELQKKVISSYNRSLINTTFSTEEVIKGGGDFCATASIILRHEIYKQAPANLLQQYVGDYPLQMYLAIKGKIYYFTDKMCVYRVENTSSWVGQHTLYSQFLKDKDKELKIYHDFDEWSNYKYHTIYKQIEKEYLFCKYWQYGKYFKARRYLLELSNRNKNVMLSRFNMKFKSIRTYSYMYGFAWLYNSLSLLFSYKK